ncbi:MAG: adenylyltransferase/cytidyltransferase family protein [Lamprobacter sp.]|uniref:adenylyltransferase/cytidyltransferase family protein n=1 Tax=Lamprobacter sp. TaxID=3100796 RepID=UPI002B262A58|nr:adenylyltransferase/cytidyltransferase family protein [Lamprobacter sp.]MEA3642683.1 adenylyltransferase/cytidyltransferase family protein [Lamprobacter sp.]
MLIGGTIGVFDLLHVGHLRFLQAVRRRCDRLQVGVGADALLARTKRPPVIDEHQRQELLAGLSCVDAVCRFDIGLDQTVASADWIAAWGIDLMVVGDDWRGSARWQRLEPELAQRGIGCLWLPYTAGISTSLIRQRILAADEHARCAALGATIAEVNRC